jgi:hypothetical protein
MTGCRARLPARDQGIKAGEVAIIREDAPGTWVVLAPVSNGHAPACGGRVWSSISIDGAKGARVSVTIVGTPSVLWVVATLLSFAEGGSTFNIRQTRKESLESNVRHLHFIAT